MKKKICTLLLATTCCWAAEAQTVIDTFEEGVSFTATLINHSPNDATVAVDENPALDAINGSDAVLLFARKTANNFWTGMFGDLKEEIKTLTRNHSRLQIKYYRTSDKSTLRIKINGDGVVGEFEPINPPTKVNEWEVLEFDYGGKGYSEIFNLDIRPDWCNEAEVEAGRRAYVDDLTLVGEPKRFDGTIATFEAGNDGFFGVLTENVALDVVPNTWANAVNSSANCLRVSRNAAGAAWEGAMKNGLFYTIGTGEGEFTYLHFDILKPLVSSLSVVIKNDPEADQPSYLDNKLKDEWEHIVVDLSQYPGKKNTIFIQPNLSEGATVAYLDNIQLSKDAALGVHAPTVSLFTVRSASVDGIEIATEGNGIVELYNAQGMLIDKQLVTAPITRLVPRQAGVLIVRYQTDGQVEAQKVLVR